SVLYYLSAFEKGYDLWSHDFREQKTSKLAAIGAEKATLELLQDDSAVIILADGTLMKVTLEGNEPVAEPAAEPVPVTAMRDLDANAERAAMLHHVWQTTRDRIYLPDILAEARWDEMYAAYAAKLPGIGNNRDFAELVDELVGELNVSHSAGHYRGQPGDITAAIGAIPDSASITDAGIRLALILPQGPLAEASDRAAAGNRIVAVNDQKLDGNTNYYALLANQSGIHTRLTLVDGKGEYDVILRPVTVAEELEWLQEQWVDSRHALVEKLSGGRLGYVYLPEMSDDSYRQVYLDVFGRDFAKEAVVIDVRDNNGGDLVDWLVQLFSGTQYMTNVPNGRPAQGEPITEWVKPSIALTNEGAYSDGHCFAYAWRTLGVSTLVGTPVTGTCTYAGWEMLQSGDVIAGTPRLGVKGTDGNWLERNTTWPDVLVYENPASVVAGADVQLAKAVEVMLSELDSR
ncbi:MAG: S41 family peptidase, partial [Halieaceae bacterium]|nr:S41 family peptidase [Halieaceae bacterium]